MDHLIFVIIAFGIAALSKALSTKGTPTPPSTPASTRRPGMPGETEQERYRRFMEAVGLPPGTPPPPPVQPRAQVNPQPLLPVNPPGGRLYRVPPSVTPPRQVTQAPQTYRRPLASSPAPAQAPVTSYVTTAAPAASPATPPPPPVRRSPPPVPTTAPATPAQALIARLRDPASIREAIILREVLGPPKALRQPWTVGPVLE